MKAALAFSLVLAGATPAFAQEDVDADATIAVDPPSAGEAPAPRVVPEGSLIEEITVTAQKREARVQDVPIAISAFSAEQLETAGIEDTKSLQAITPGLQFSGAVGFDLVYLRGIGTDAFLPSFDPSVATYIDGIYIPAGQGVFTSLGGVARVEVLKGPQGTLYGRNSTGGAINVTTRNPDAEPALEVSMEYGRFDDQKLNVYTNIPIAEGLAVNAAVLYASRDAYYDLIEQAPDDPYAFPRDVTKAGRVKIGWTPNDVFDITLSAFRLRSPGVTGMISPLRHPSPLATALLLHPAANDYETAADADMQTNVNQTLISGDVTLHLDPFDVRFIGGDQKIQTNPIIYDFDGTHPTLVTFNAADAFANLKTGEFQLVSNDTSWGADWLKWIAGVYALRQRAGYDPSIFSVAGSGQAGDGSLLFGLIPPAVVDQLGLEDFLDQLPPGIPTGAGPGVQLRSHGVLLTHAYSGFFETTVSFTEALRLTLGGRYQEEDRSLPVQHVAVPSTGGGEQTVFPWNQPKVKQNNFSPKVSVDWKPFDRVMLYATFSQGYKSGSYNIVTIYVPPGYVKPEKATAFEVGFKTDLLGGNLRFNGALFTTKIDDLQQQFTSLFNSGAVTVENVGSARSRGAEFDFVALPLPNWNPGLVINGGASYIQAKYLDYPNASGFDPMTGIFGTNFDFSGNRISRVPKVTANLGVMQRIETGWGPIELGVDGYYNDGFYFTAQNSPDSHQGSYVLTNARASFTFAKLDLKLTAFVDNIEDETYAVSSFTNDFGVQTTLAVPRTYGVRVNLSFE